MIKIEELFKILATYPKGKYLAYSNRGKILHNPKDTDEFTLCGISDELHDKLNSEV